jgi:hypothetical protein
MMRGFTVASVVILALPSWGIAGQLRCPPLFVSDGGQVVCAVANYGRPGQVTVRMRDGSNGRLIERNLAGERGITTNLGRNREAGVYHNVVSPDGLPIEAHAVICEVTVPVNANFRASLTRLADAAAPDDDGDGTPEFAQTNATNGGESVECR